MKAMIIDSLGDANVFRQVERDRPKASAGHLVLEVKATSVNPLDTMLRSAETPWSANLPEILHGDVAGVIVEVGEGVEQFRVGDEVYGCAGGIAGTQGALAEYMLVDADLMAHKPQILSMREAAALPLVSITAWEALVSKMHIKPGDNVLIHGATGGVGHIAVQLAKVLGATVATTSLARNIDLAHTLGADQVINAEQQSVEDYTQQLTGGLGFDAIFDTIAGDHIQNSFKAARYNGKVATILPISDPLQVALKGLSFHSVLMPIPLVYGINRKAHGEILTHIAKLVDEGQIKPIVDESQYSIWEVSKGHQRLESKQATGKVVLTA
ncbi:zinc-dependent alcohol dehydrogenase family protein [Photobacterium lutimaris]|uniref:Quinone oxidoreductase n=1 Tax=Photobacterium lutimaris TaxID=388278 RepID=A0A2T3IQ71_9GAMM|nr:zinc-dependent alcohol dehydrogenase family protein [Photobacterium lutimaris]PSU30486.1 quinone oxidoreductase [Photobacterium lutimaris]TDR76042.1 NADPH2:quinone reductase [Photobacterium lutimaris]